MDKIIKSMQMWFTGLGAAIGGILGGWDGFLYTLLLFVVVDYLTGVISAVVEKDLSSQIGFIGILKKVAIFCLVAIASAIDTKIIQSGSVIRTAVIFFYISNEGISILENASRIGLPVPKKLQAVLKQLKDDSEGDADQKGAE